MTDINNDNPPETRIKLFSDVDRSGEVIVKHYYDLFAYHASQRLTTFNFFVVSLSFLCSAYALLVTKGNDNPIYFNVALGLSLVAVVLIVFFARLDRRNAQIIRLNEIPLESIQKAMAVRLVPDAPEKRAEFETVRLTGERAIRLQTFGTVIPLIYTTSLGLALLGAAQAIFFLSKTLSSCVFLLAMFGCAAIFLIGMLLINFNLLGIKQRS